MTKRFVYSQLFAVVWRLRKILLEGAEMTSSLGFIVPYTSQ